MIKFLAGLATGAALATATICYIVGALDHHEHRLRIPRIVPAT